LEEFSIDEVGLLWLKLKSIVRREFINEFILKNNIKLQETTLGNRFKELFKLLAHKPTESHKILNDYIRLKNVDQLATLNTNEIVSELYKLKYFDWGGDYQNSLDRYLVSRYVKVIKSYDTLVSKFDNEISIAVQGYVLNSWYNHWSSIIIENLFKSHDLVLPTVGKIKNVDFFIRNIPFDLKVTYLPAEYVKSKRREKGLPIEITYLKKKARELNINFSNQSKENNIYYEIIEKLKDRGTEECAKVINTLKADTISILREAVENPHILTKWLYENQGEMRFSSENRLFLVLVDTNDITGSWKLKRNIDLLKPAINNYLDNFADKKLDDLKINFKYRGKPQTYSAYTDVIFIVK
jgi:hypothetical protein